MVATEADELVPKMKWKNPFEKYIAEIVFFFFKVADAFLEPCMRLYIYKLSASMHHTEDENIIQQNAAGNLMIYKILVNLPALLLGLFCGAWSDKIGRKFPVMICCFGTILACLFFIGSLGFENQPNYQKMLIFMGAAIRGCFGRSAVISMALHSYIADMTSEKARTRRLGRLLSMNYFGYFVGSVSMGFILNESNFDRIFIVVIMLSALCVFMATFGMYDNTADRNDDSERSSVYSDIAEADNEGGDAYKDLFKDNTKKLEQPFKITNFKDTLGMLTEERPNNNRCHLMTLFSIIIVTQLCKSGEIDVTVLFVERSPFHWNEAKYGYLLGADYACMGVMVLCVLPLLTKHLKWQDTSLIFVGLIFKLSRLFVLAFSSSTWMVYFAIVLGCPLSFIISGVKSMISKIVSEDEIGKTFSMLSCGETLSNLLGSVIFTNVYALSAEELFPGFVYIVDVIFHFIMLFCSCALFYDIEELESKRRAKERCISSS